MLLSEGITAYAVSAVVGHFEPWRAGGIIGNYVNLLGWHPALCHHENLLAFLVYSHIHYCYYVAVKPLVHINQAVAHLQVFRGYRLHLFAHRRAVAVSKHVVEIFAEGGIRVRTC